MALFSKEFSELPEYQYHQIYHPPAKLTCARRELCRVAHRSHALEPMHQRPQIDDEASCRSPKTRARGLSIRMPLPAAQQFVDCVLGSKQRPTHVELGILLEGFGISLQRGEYGRYLDRGRRPHPADPAIA